MLYPSEVIEKFWRNVNKQGPASSLGDACWLWRGKSFSGRERRPILFLPRRKRIYASRFALELLLNRHLAPGELALHACDNPVCVRGSHLFTGTQKDNIRDAMAKGRFRCPPRDGTHNSRHRLSESDVLAIVERCQAGALFHEIAAEFGVGGSTISGIMRGVRWSTLTGLGHSSGRRRGAQNRNARLTPTITGEIKRLRASGLSQDRIAVRVGLGQTTVSRVLRGDAWTERGYGATKDSTIQTRAPSS